MLEEKLRETIRRQQRRIDLLKVDERFQHEQHYLLWRAMVRANNCLKARPLTMKGVEKAQAILHEAELTSDAMYDLWQAEKKAIRAQYRQRQKRALQRAVRGNEVTS